MPVSIQKQDLWLLKRRQTIVSDLSDFPAVRGSSTLDTRPHSVHPNLKLPGLGIYMQKHFSPQWQWYILGIKLNLLLHCAHFRHSWSRTHCGSSTPTWLPKLWVCVQESTSFSVSSTWPLWGQDANSVPCPGCWPLFHLIKTLPLTTNRTPATAHLYIPHYSKTQKVLPTFLFSFPIFFLQSTPVRLSTPCTISCKWHSWSLLPS